MDMLLVILGILSVPVLLALAVVAFLVWRASREDVEESPPPADGPRERP
jgi:hypothetical protein